MSRNMESLDIIQRLLEEQRISAEEAMTLVRDIIRTNKEMISIPTPFPAQPNKPFTLYESVDTTISTNEYPIEMYIKSE